VLITPLARTGNFVHNGWVKVDTGFIKSNSTSHMEINTQAKILSAESKPYSFGGNEGVSHRIRLNVDGEIYVCKSTESQVKEIKDKVGAEGMARIKVLSRKETLSLELVSFE